MERFFDEDTLRRMRGYAGRDLFKPREVTETVFSKYGSESWALGDFETMIAQAASKIPPSSRERAMVDLEGGYEESTSLVIHYNRLETPEEVEERVQRAYRFATDEQAKERRTYETLKAKFG